MSGFVLDNEQAENNFFRELRNSINGEVQRYSFGPPKNYKPAKQAFWCTINLHGSMWKSGRLDYTDLTHIVPGDEKGEYFGKNT